MLPRPILVVLSLLLVVVLCAVAISGAALGALFALACGLPCLGRLRSEPLPRRTRAPRATLARGPPLF